MAVPRPKSVSYPDYGVLGRSGLAWVHARLVANPDMIELAPNLAAFIQCLAEPGTKLVNFTPNVVAFAPKLVDLTPAGRTCPMFVRALVELNPHPIYAKFGQTRHKIAELGQHNSSKSSRIRANPAQAWSSSTQGRCLRRLSPNLDLPIRFAVGLGCRVSASPQTTSMDEAKATRNPGVQTQGEASNRTPCHEPTAAQAVGCMWPPPAWSAPVPCASFVGRPSVEH